MEYASHESTYTARGCFTVLMMIIASVLACGGIFYVVVDASCVADADFWLEDYPYSVLEQQTYSFARPFGIGQTTRLLYTPDHINQVRAWYMARDKERIEAGNVKNRGYARMTYLLREVGNRTGTSIALVSNCAQGLSIGMEQARISE